MRMILMTLGALAGRAALGTVTRGAGRLGRKQNIRCILAAPHVVTFLTRYLRVLGVIEAAANKPPIHDDRFCDFRRAGRRFNFVAIRTTRIPRAGGSVHPGNTRGRASMGVAQENCAFQFLAGTYLVLQPRELLLHKSIHFRLGSDVFHTRGIVGILRRQAAQESAHELRITVRQTKVRILRVEL